MTIKFVTALGNASLSEETFYRGLVQHVRNMSLKESLAYFAEETGYKEAQVKATILSFVGEESAKKVKEVLDGLAAELNAPRFGKAGTILKGLGMDLEWDFAVSRIPGDAEVASVRKMLMDGEIPFNATLQNQLCVVLGVEAYNAFVTEYNGK